MLVVRVLVVVVSYCLCETALEQSDKFSDFHGVSQCHEFEPTTT